MVNQHIAFESTELYQLMPAEGLINRTPGKEGKHMVTLWLLSVVQYQLNICTNTDIFKEKKKIPSFFKNVCTCIKSLCFHLFWN